MRKTELEAALVCQGQAASPVPNQNTALGEIRPLPTSWGWWFPATVHRTLLKLAHFVQFDSEQNKNYVLFSFRYEGRVIMVRAVAEEALALASISLFLAMVAVWAQVLGVV
jgi:hypothetical protein